VIMDFTVIMDFSAAAERDCTAPDMR